jgi:ribonuclease P protein component
LEQFPKGKRLLTRLDYSRVFSKSKRLHNKHFTVLVHLTKATQPARLGLMVSKKVHKSAVKRNRIKRLIRETFRTHKNLRPADYVVMAKPGVAQTSNLEITASLNHLWQQTENRR